MVFGCHSSRPAFSFQSFRRAIVLCDESRGTRTEDNDNEKMRTPKAKASRTYHLSKPIRLSAITQKKSVSRTERILQEHQYYIPLISIEHTSQIIIHHSEPLPVAVIGSLKERHQPGINTKYKQRKAANRDLNNN